VPVQGRFWIRESDGAVLRSRAERAFVAARAPQDSVPVPAEAPRGSMAVTTEYGEDSGLGLLAPLEMVETLEWRTEQALRTTRAGPPLVVFVHGSIEGRARYSAFRRLGGEGGQAKP
jgi:hypothetical protein